MYIFFTFLKLSTHSVCLCCSTLFILLFYKTQFISFFNSILNPFFLSCYVGKLFFSTYFTVISFLRGRLSSVLNIKTLELFQGNVFLYKARIARMLKRKFFFSFYVFKKCTYANNKSTQRYTHKVLL